MPNRRIRYPSALLLLVALAAMPTCANAQGAKADYERAAGLRKLTQGKVFKARVQPFWFDSGNRFWYRNDLAAGKREFVLVDAVKGSRSAAFDHAKLAKALGAAVHKKIAADELPIENVDFGLAPGSVVFLAEKKVWEWKPQTATLAERPDLKLVARSLPQAMPWARTRTTGEATVVVFKNETNEELQLFWVDSEGTRKAYGSIKPGETRPMNTYAGHVWLLTGKDGRTVGCFEAREWEGTAIVDGTIRERMQGGRGAFGWGPQSQTSKDGKTVVTIKDDNVWLRDKASGQETQLTFDGKDGDGYRDLYWAPDSKKLVAFRIRAGEEHKVYYVESSPPGRVQPVLHSMDYPKPGDRLDRAVPHLFDLVNKKEIPVSDALFDNPYDIADLHWAPDSSEFYFWYNQRGHQVGRVVGVNAATGATRAVVEETTKTFIDYSGKSFRYYLDDTSEYIWMSERDGWNHLYLYDLKTGQVKNQITKGEWVVRSVERVDPVKRQIWFQAGGVVPGQDPYYVHRCRIDFDGSNFVDLTPGDGTHTTTPSPDGRFYIDTYSRVDMPPVNELRRLSDGGLICALEKGDASALLKTGWKMPERFVAKGRDGKTDIYGVIWRPTNYNPRRKYPVIENIYAGPHGSFTPKNWSSFYATQELAELGFIVVQMDGMGTSDRSKAFHDVCWKNLADAGFPDRILWMKAAAAKYPSMDVTRVGIYGGSAGGQNAMGAVLFHPEFYKVAIADCGCHDNRMDKVWWNEQWMGYPVGPEYEASSNVVNAHKLQGKLFLIVGEMDTNVDPATTMQVVNALIKADKDFDLLVVPGGGHCPGGAPYGLRRQRDFFVRNLLGVEPRRK